MYYWNDWVQAIVHKTIGDMIEKIQIAYSKPTALFHIHLGEDMMLAYRSTLPPPEDALKFVFTSKKGLIKHIITSHSSTEKIANKYCVLNYCYDPKLPKRSALILSNAGKGHIQVIDYEIDLTTMSL